MCSLIKYAAVCIHGLHKRFHGLSPFLAAWDFCSLTGPETRVQPGMAGYLPCQLGVLGRLGAHLSAELV